MRNSFKTAILAAGLVATGACVAADSIQALANTCNNCHGVNGVSAGGAMPSIAGQSADYLKTVMMEWKRGERAAGTMNRLAKGYTDEQIDALAKHFAKLPWVPVVQKASADVLMKGKDATDRCESCHGVTGGAPDGDDIPRLNGQQAKFLELEMMKYRDEGFHMTHKKMIKNVRKMDEANVEIAAKYYGAQSK